VTPTDVIPAAVSAVVAVVLAPLLGGLGSRVGLVDWAEDEIKIHRTPVPVLGGVAVVVAAGIGMAAGGHRMPWSLSVAVAVALLGGLVDDARPLPAWVRVLLLILAGATLTTGFDGVTVVAAVGVPLLALACANAVNIVDGQDGLAGGLAAIAALALAVLGGIRGDEIAVAVGLAGAGALIGFLPWNWPRARLFLGNGGAYAIGVGLAFLAARNVADDGWRGLLAAGTCLGVFAFEVAFTVARRATAGGAITAGDRLHSYDLLSRTSGRVTSTAWFWALGLLAGALGVAVGVLPLAVGAPLVAGAALGGSWWGFHLWARRQAVT
jgi:UDP-GlcNAc:undecaprenyl-phosphate/decaprenyl-phosphate GlcNAc-1-phosphate transferase